MAESESAPRKTTTYKDFEGMASENERYNVKPNEMFFLENIMRIAPHKLHSVPGPGFPTQFPLPNLCTDATKRGQQIVHVVGYFPQDTSFPPNGNLRTSWGYVSPTEELFSLMGDANCGGGNINYDTCCQMNRYQTPGSLTHPALIDPSHAVLFSSQIVGTSDEPIYATGYNTATDPAPGNRFYFPNSSTSIYCDTRNTDGNVAIVNFAKKGNRLYCLSDPNFDSSRVEILVFDTATGGAPLQRLIIFTGAGFAKAINVTSNFIYFFANNLTPPFPQTIYKCNIADGSIADQFDVTFLGIYALAVVDDTLIYALSANPPTYYYLENFTDLIYIGKAPEAFSSPLGGVTAIFTSGALYYGTTGFGGESTTVFKTIVQCPPDTGVVIATISVSESTIPAGGTVHFDFGPIAQPDATDEVILTADNSYFYNGGVLASQSTASASSGTGVSFTIPGGTAPGNYRLDLTTAFAARPIARSNVFTVT